MYISDWDEWMKKNHIKLRGAVGTDDVKTAGSGVKTDLPDEKAGKLVAAIVSEGLTFLAKRRTGGSL